MPFPSCVGAPPTPRDQLVLIHFVGLVVQVEVELESLSLAVAALAVELETDPLEERDGGLLVHLGVERHLDEPAIAAEPEGLTHQRLRFVNSALGVVQPGQVAARRCEVAMVGVVGVEPLASRQHLEVEVFGLVKVEAPYCILRVKEILEAVRNSRRGTYDQKIVRQLLGVSRATLYNKLGEYEIGG